MAVVQVQNVEPSPGSVERTPDELANDWSALSAAFTVAGFMNAFIVLSISIASRGSTGDSRVGARDTALRYARHAGAARPNSKLKVGVGKILRAFDFRDRLAATCDNPRN